MVPRRADSLDRVPANSVAIDDYLKTIYHHTEWQSVAITPSQLAAELALAPSTVTEMVQKLAALGLVSHRPYGPVSLTDAGRARAAAIIRRHRLIETWLVREFDYAWDEVHDEAEVLEHAISDRLLEGISARLGHPTRDPHGDAIPDASSFRSWMIDANDGIIATASLLQGFAGAGASDRLLLLAATAATIAGGLSAGGAKWAEVAAEREAEQRLAPRVAQLAVLRDGVVERLRVVGFELDRRDGKAVDEEYEVDRVLVLGRVVHLAHDAQTVLREAPVRLLVEGRVGRELRERERGRGLLEPLAQRGECAAALVERKVERLHEPVEQLFARVRLLRCRRLGLHDLRELLGLGLFEPREEVGRIQRADSVVAAVFRLGLVDPAVRREVFADLGLKSRFVMDAHATAVSCAERASGAVFWVGAVS